MESSQQSGSSRTKDTEYISPRLDLCLARFRERLGANTDLVIREFSLNPSQSSAAAVIYLENLAGKTQIQQNILTPLTAVFSIQAPDPERIRLFLQTQLASANQTKMERTYGEAVNGILEGATVLLVAGLNEAFAFDTRDFPERRIGNPQIEVTLRGPRESFVESIGTNTALLRRRISHPDLVVESCRAGCMTRTEIRLVYLKGVSNDQVIGEIRKRLERIQTNHRPS